MFLIVGLGNPEKNYRYTRHNIGFEVINKMSYDFNILINKVKFKAHIGQGIIQNQKILFIKPQTFMNLSGQSVIEALNFYKLTSENLIVIYDDVDLDVGDIRIRQKGSAGGHNGIKNIISHLGTDEFLRIKVGIGSKPPKMDLADYVLSGFSKTEEEDMVSGITKAGDATEMILKDGVSSTMNKFNTKKKGDLN